MLTFFFWMLCLYIHDHAIIPICSKDSILYIKFLIISAYHQLSKHQNIKLMEKTMPDSQFQRIIVFWEFRVKICKITHYCSFKHIYFLHLKKNPCNQNVEIKSQLKQVLSIITRKPFSNIGVENTSKFQQKN